MCNAPTFRDPPAVVYGFLFLCDCISTSRRAESHALQRGRSPLNVNGCTVLSYALTILNLIIILALLCW